MAQISDEAVRARTGKDWRSWFEILDAGGCATMTHKQIVAFLKEFDVAPWWQQSITVAYEKARGLRMQHETPEGFQVSASRTIDASVEAAYHAWVSDRERLDWLPEDRLIITTKNRNKSVRGTWAGGASRIDVYFYPRESGRTQVAVSHTRLADAAAANSMKAYWSVAMDRLRAYLEARSDDASARR